MSNIRIGHMTLGIYQTNCYFVYRENSDKVLVFDPADHGEKIEEALGQHGLHTAAILLTHGHFDHIQANDSLRDKTEAPLAIHADDAELLLAPEKVCAGMYMQVNGCREPEILLHNGDVISFGPYQLRVIYTPGHSRGGCCFYEVAEKVCFTGDTLFRGSIGRTDLYGGDYALLLKSVRERLQLLADDTVIYPGHGPESVMAFERKNNPYLK